MWEYGPGPRATGAIWSRLAEAGPGPEIGGAVVGLPCAGYAAPSVWLTLGTFNRGLNPGLRQLGEIGRVGQSRVPGRGLHWGAGGLRPCGLAGLVRRDVRVGCPGQAPGTQVPKPPLCTTRAANRPLPLVWGVCGVVLLRGFEPHSHPRTESSGLVWGGPSPPVLARRVGCPLTRGLRWRRP
jgi:hypothetical protein